MVLHWGVYGKGKNEISDSGIHSGLPKVNWKWEIREYLGGRDFCVKYGHIGRLVDTW